MEEIVSEIRTALSGATVVPQADAEGGPGAVKLKQNVCYIVAATILDEEGRVLMMREAKATCRGKWYLPAGKMKRDETIEAAVVRETLEETGLRIQPTALLCIELQAMFWFRFTFTGNVIGGKLKTEKDEDQESIEAGWFSPEEVMSKLELRATDIVPLITNAARWNNAHKTDPLCRCLPVKMAHSRIAISLVLIRHNKENENFDILGFKPPDQAIPSLPVWTAESCFSDIMTVIDRLVNRAGQAEHKVHGVLQLEHSTTSNKHTDGLHLTVLAEVGTCSGELCEKYLWMSLADAGKKLRKLISSEGYVKLIPLG